MKIFKKLLLGVLVLFSFALPINTQFGGGVHNWILEHPDGLKGDFFQDGLPDGSSFTRATTASVPDFEKIINDALSGEIRNEGARRVENLIPNSESLESSPWVPANSSATEIPVVTDGYATAPDGTETASRIQITVHNDMFDGTNTHTGDAITGTTTLQSIASNWGASEMNTFLNGVAGTASTFDDDFDLGATLGVGSNSDGTLSLFGTLKNLKIWKRKLPNNLLVGYTL